MHDQYTYDTASFLARQFHDTYERLAPSYGYETREETREFNPDTPNGKLMIAVCLEIISDRAIIERTDDKLSRRESRDPAERIHNGR